jgi:hypothetical protein
MFLRSDFERWKWCHFCLLIEKACLGHNCRLFHGATHLGYQISQGYLVRRCFCRGECRRNRSEKAVVMLHGVDHFKSGLQILASLHRMAVDLNSQCLNPLC